MSAQLPILECQKVQPVALDLKDCHIYTNWFSRTISWLFGRSVDIQVGEDVLRVSTSDLAKKFFYATRSGRPHLFGETIQKSRIERELKELASSGYTPLTKDVMQIYVNKLSMRYGEGKQEFFPNDVIVEVISKLTGDKTGKISERGADFDASVRCVTKYVEGHKTNELEFALTALNQQ